jgi:hypothetical protein
VARLRQEALEQEQRQAEEQARRALEEQARVQRKQQEVLQLQVGGRAGGRGSRRWGLWAFGDSRRQVRI